MKYVFPLTMLLLLAGMGDSCAARVLLLRDSFPKASQRFYSQLKSSATAAGVSMEEVGGTDLASALGRESGPGSILLLPNARYFPAEAKGAIQDFLKRGNHLMAISGPPFKELVVRAGGGWITKALTKVELTHDKGSSILDFSKTDLSGWRRVSGAMQSKTQFGVADSGDPEVPKSLHVTVSKLDNWDTIFTPPMTQPFPGGSTATVFWAKGGPRTPELIVEWREKDGSRWMGIVTLTTEWVRYALTPADFRYWSDNPSVKRGGPGDHFDPANAEVLSFGLASGISKQDLGIGHEFWVSDVRAVDDPFAKVDFTQPFLETLSPTYKTYSTSAATLDVVTTRQKIPTAAEVVSPIARAPGLGCDEARAARFIPVVRALDGDGELRGTAAHLYLNASGDYKGSVWGYLGFDQGFLDRTSEQSAALVVSMLQRMKSGVFLLNAGTDQPAYTIGEDVKSGAYVVNGGDSAVQAAVDFAVIANGKQLESASANVALSARVMEKPAWCTGGEWKLPAGEYVLRAVLKVGGQTVDQIDQPFRVISYVDSAAEHRVTVKGSDFYLDGTKWYPIGMNYWPRYSMGLENSDWGRWTIPAQYNPELVEQDLSLAEKQGINMLSVQFSGTDQARGMMDFLARCEKHNIKLHAYIPGLDPLNQNFELARKLIEGAHLRQNPAFFAYDVGWEVHVGNYDRRSEFDGQWRKWVAEQYGSAENAENDWGYRPKVTDGGITGPSDEQLAKDGDWRVYVAAYRRFWDDEISRRYMQVRNFLKSVDPQALVCARSGYGGTGAMYIVPRFPFDLASGAKHLDFTSPEAYALGGDRLGFLKGGFVTEYGRAASGGKPVFWAEYGASIWPQCDAERLEQQRRYYENMLSMTVDSGANGSAGWWWPGGYRVNEGSDFGVTNPDGAPRPALLEVGKVTESFRTPRELPAPDCFIDVDRDKYVTGFAGIYAACADEYVKLMEQGKRPAVRLDGQGTTSVDCPLTAVGNVPCDGTNPPKYLNAEFNYLKINGQVTEDGAVVEVPRGKPVSFEASVGNIGVAEWISPTNAKTGGVWLEVRSDAGSEVIARGAVSADTEFLADARVPGTQLNRGVAEETVLRFRMAAADRVEFGQVLRVTLRPR